MSLAQRARTIVSGNIHWVDPETGEAGYDYERRAAWAVAGPQVSNWWWVRRWGSLPCGCVKNPITRRWVSYAVTCTEHCAWMEWHD